MSASQPDDTQQCDFCFAPATWRGDVDQGEPRDACSTCFEARCKNGEFSGGVLLDGET